MWPLIASSALLRELQDEGGVQKGRGSAPAFSCPLCASDHAWLMNFVFI